MHSGWKLKTEFVAWRRPDSLVEQFGFDESGKMAQGTKEALNSRIYRKEAKP
jgi:hypothetical protein